MRHNSAITVERSENAVNGRLQGRRVIAQFARFSESLIDVWIERDDAAGELVELSLRSRRFGPRPRQDVCESTGNLRRPGRKRHGEAALGGTQIGAGQSDSR